MPSAGSPIARLLAIVSGRCGLQISHPASNAVATGLAALGLGAVEGREGAVDQADLAPLADPAGDLGEQRPRGDRADDPAGQLPAELLDGLEGDRLRALGVVGAQVDVDEGPRVLLGELGAEPVDVVVGAPHADQLGAVDAGREQLLLLEVGGDEDIGLESRRRPRGPRPRWRGCRSRRRRRSRSRARVPLR